MNRQTYNSHSPKLPPFLPDIHPSISVWNLMASTHADLLLKLTVVPPIKMPSTTYGAGDFTIVPTTGCRCAQFWSTPKYITFLRTILFNTTSCTAKTPNMSTPFRFSVHIFRKKCYLPRCANVSPIIFHLIAQSFAKSLYYATFIMSCLLTTARLLLLSRRSKYAHQDAFIKTS